MILMGSAVYLPWRDGSVLRLAIGAAIILLGVHWATQAFRMRMKPISEARYKSVRESWCVGGLLGPLSLLATNSTVETLRYSIFAMMMMVFLLLNDQPPKES